jgi:hypothetical protein
MVRSGSSSASTPSGRTRSSTRLTSPTCMSEMSRVIWSGTSSGSTSTGRVNSTWSATPPSSAPGASPSRTIGTSTEIFTLRSTVTKSTWSTSRRTGWRWISRAIASCGSPVDVEAEDRVQPGVGVQRVVELAAVDRHGDGLARGRTRRRRRGRGRHGGGARLALAGAGDRGWRLSATCLDMADAPGVLVVAGRRRARRRAAWVGAVWASRAACPMRSAGEPPATGSGRRTAR